MRGLGVGYEYLPEPGPVPVRFTDERTGEDREVVCELLGYADIGGGFTGGIRAIIREPGSAWLRSVYVRRLMVPAVQDAFQRRAK